MEPRYGISASGFDNFLDETSMNPNGEKFRGWYSDAEEYNKIIDIFNKKKAGQPLFLFNVTIQNHGGYLIADKNFKEEIKIKDEKATDTANRYLSLIHESDRAFEKIINYFKNQKRTNDCCNVWRSSAKNFRILSMSYYMENL